jgi:predicted nucleic acid-binding protein
MMDYEISFNPFDNRRNQIQKWKSVTNINIQYSENNILLANEIQKQKIKVKDSIHIACAIEAECKYYITTDDKLLNKNIDNIIITDPISFIKQMGV